jgi:hypothetical protein
VLRYLGDAYRALRQTVPDSVRTDELEDLTEWLGTLVRQTDSSLLDEWEALSDPTRVVAPDVLPPVPERITANERAFMVLVRNALFRRVELAALRRWGPLGELEADNGSTMTGEDWRVALEGYFAQHDSIDTGPDARGPAMLVVDRADTVWEVQQILGDPAGDHDWRVAATVDLAASDDEGRLVMDVTGLRQL